MERREFLKSAAGAVLGVLATSGMAAVASPRVATRPLRVNLLRAGVPNSNGRIYTFEAARDILEHQSGKLIPIHLSDRVDYDAQLREPIVGVASDFELDENGYLSAAVELHEQGDVRTFVMGSGCDTDDGYYKVQEITELKCLCLHPAGDGAIWPWMK